MTLGQHHFADITSVASYTKGSDEGYQADYQDQISLKSYISPFFHQHSDDIAEENQH